jgi:hypothetical protein
MIRHRAKVAIPQSQMMVLYACLKCEMGIYLANVISGPPVWDRTKRPSKAKVSRRELNSAGMGFVISHMFGCGLLGKSLLVCPLRYRGS